MRSWWIIGTAPVWLASAATAQPASVADTLSMMQGLWKGSATGMGPEGKPFAITQTERVGALLDGRLVAIEGRGYDADTTLKFNAFAVISRGDKPGTLEFRAYQGDDAGTFAMSVDGRVVRWQRPAGPGAIVRFTIDFTQGNWHEIGEYLADGKPPAKIIELNLSRVADTDWPRANPVLP